MSTINKIEILEFSFPVKNVGPAENGFDTVYVPNTTGKMSTLATRIETADGVVGEYVGGMTAGLPPGGLSGAASSSAASAFHRLEFYEESKRALRKFDKMGVGPLDIALWDWAGKRLETSVANLIGSSRDAHSGLCQHLSRRPQWRPVEPGGLRLLCRALRRAWLSRLQDARLGRGQRRGGGRVASCCCASGSARR